MECLDIDLSSKLVQYFDKAAHVCSFEVVRKVHINIDGGVDGLCAPFAVKNNDGVFNSLDADLFDIDIPVIFLILNVNHLVLPSYETRAFSDSQTVTRH